MLKFYFTPGSCSTGIHILLEELELIFEAHRLDLLAGDQFKEEYVAMNPKSSMPMLVLDDGEVITEFQAIAWYLAQSYPKAKLLPEDPLQQIRVLEMMDYVVATVHMQGFARIFTTDQFCDDPDHYEAIKQKGKHIIRKGFDIIDQQLADKDYICSGFSIADAALFYVEFWAAKLDIPLAGNCARHYQTMCSRPVVQQVLMEEGYRI
jgi:glutathione S-transferase